MKNKLKIISWNVNRNNILNYSTCNKILENNFDIIFFQEVNVSNIEIIKKFFNGYDLFFATEVLYSFKKKTEYYLVTLIKNYLTENLISSRTGRLDTCVKPIYKIFSRRIDVEYLELVIGINHKNLTLINCHLQYVASPKDRKNQFSNILKNIGTDSFVIAGDLNTFSNPFLALFLGLPFGYSIEDYKKIESRSLLKNNKFQSGKLVNTTVYYTGKLDWILLSKDFCYLEEYKFSLLGSDHYPLIVECEI